MDPADLLYRAKWGELSGLELDWLRRELGRRDTAHNRYTLLHALGKGVMRSPAPLRAGDIDLVASFLVEGVDAELAGLALRVLCQMWGVGDRFEAELERFCKGVPWDNEYSDLAEAAVGCLAVVIRGVGHHRLLAVLLDRITGLSGDVLAEAATLTAIGRALGADWSQLPPVGAAWPASAAEALVGEARRVLSNPVQ